MLLLAPRGQANIFIRRSVSFLNPKMLRDDGTAYPSALSKHVGKLFPKRACW